MLIAFGVENYRSIATKQSFSMVATRRSRAKLRENSFVIPSSPPTRLLKSSVIYGANASGKTNVLRALFILKKMVTESAFSMKPTEHIPVESFKLDSILSSQPTRLEIAFIQNNIQYDYILSLDSQRIYEETLIAYPQKRSQTWYRRIYDPQTNRYDWYFGSQLKSDKQLIKNLVRPNSLFLSHAAQNNHLQLTPVFQWFYEKLILIDLYNYPMNFGMGYTKIRCYKDAKLRDLVIDFLQIADLDICDIVISRKSLDKKGSDDQDSLIELAQMMLMGSLFEDEEDFKLYNVKTFHKNHDGQLVEFSLLEESSGTQRLFEIIGPALEAILYGKVIVIDELGKSLHPHLSRLIIESFHDSNNPQGGQLIFTTHDTTLLNNNILRKDQIWFTEKNNQATQLYSLINFQPYSKESWQYGYLQGRYGAIPFIKLK